MEAFVLKILGKYPVDYSIASEEIQKKLLEKRCEKYGLVFPDDDPSRILTRLEETTQVHLDDIAKIPLLSHTSDFHVITLGLVFGVCQLDILADNTLHEYLIITMMSWFLSQMPSDEIIQNGDISQIIPVHSRPIPFNEIENVLLELNVFIARINDEHVKYILALFGFAEEYQITGTIEILNSAIERRSRVLYFSSSAITTYQNMKKCKYPSVLFQIFETNSIEKSYRLLFSRKRLPLGKPLTLTMLNILFSEDHLIVSSTIADFGVFIPAFCNQKDYLLRNLYSYRYVLGGNFPIEKFFRSGRSISNFLDTQMVYPPFPFLEDQLLQYRDLEILAWSNTVPGFSDRSDMISAILRLEKQPGFFVPRYFSRELPQAINSFDLLGEKIDLSPSPNQFGIPKVPFVAFGIRSCYHWIMISELVGAFSLSDYPGIPFHPYTYGILPEECVKRLFNLLNYLNKFYPGIAKSFPLDKETYQLYSHQALLIRSIVRFHKWKYSEMETIFDLVYQVLEGDNLSEEEFLLFLSEEDKKYWKIFAEFPILGSSYKVEDILRKTIDKNNIRPTINFLSRFLVK